MTKNNPRYSVGTWDANRNAFTPQAGIGRSINITLRTLRRRLHALRECGYTAHRRGVNREDNDAFVLVEKTDGLPRKEILERWKR